MRRPNGLEPKGNIASTSVFAQIEATRLSAGIGLVPTYMARKHPELIRVLPDFHHDLAYWAVMREESRRSRPTQLMLTELVRVGQVITRSG